MATRRKPHRGTISSGSVLTFAFRGNWGLRLIQPVQFVGTGHLGKGTCTRLSHGTEFGTQDSGGERSDCDVTPSTSGAAGTAPTVFAAIAMPCRLEVRHTSTCRVSFQS